MTPEEIKWILELVTKYGVGAIVAGLIGYALIKHYLGGYLPEKGKNLATKEDVEKITHLVKGVEHQYNVLIKQMEAKQQLRMAALDKRLLAHQESFALWRKLIGSSGPAAVEVVMECQTWWENNCLYLEPEVRQAFAVAYTSFNMRQQMIDARSPGTEIAEVWKEVMAFPSALFKAVQLPTLSVDEQNALFVGLPRDDRPA